MTNRRKLFFAFGCATFLKIAVFLVAIIHPIPAGMDYPLSPLTVCATDMWFYVPAKDALFKSPKEYFKPVLNFYSLGEENGVSKGVPGPLYLALLHLFRYETGHTLPLASLYLMGCILLAWIWLKWFSEQGVSLGWMLVFAAIPSALSYMFTLGTDLPAAVFFGVFVVNYFRPGGWSKANQVLWFSSLVLLLLTRPNFLVVSLFVAGDLFFLGRMKGLHISIGLRLSVLMLTIVFGLFYLPYFMWRETGFTAKLYSFYGIHPDDFIRGLFPSFPRWCDLLCSWGLMLLSKILFLVGMRPSYLVGSWVSTLARWIPGILYLSGLLICLHERSRLSILVSLFILPFLVTGINDGALERYFLPIMPVLFYYCVQSWGISSEPKAMETSGAMMC